MTIFDLYWTLHGTMYQLSLYHYYLLLFPGFVPFFAFGFEDIRTASWSNWLWSINVFIFIYLVFILLHRILSMISDMRNEQIQTLSRWRAACEIKEDFDHRNGHLLNMPVKNAILFIIGGWCQLGLIILFLYFEIYNLDDETSPLFEGPDFVLRINTLILCATVLQCIYFRYDFADKLYHSVCGSLHKRCKQCCERIADKKKRSPAVEVRNDAEGIAVEMVQIGAEIKPLSLQVSKQLIQVDDDSANLEIMTHNGGTLLDETVLSAEPSAPNASDLRSEFASMLNGVDLTVFGDMSSKCNQSTSAASITAYCPCLQRLCAGMKYVETLADRTDLNDAKKREMFMEFNQQIYKSVLDDAIHLFHKHSDDIKQIHTEWTEQYGLSICSVAECLQTNRHCSRRTHMRFDVDLMTDEDGSYTFYNELYDRVHFYIFHLFEVGLRVEEAQWLIEHKDAEIEQDDREHRVYIDRQFAAQRDHIVSKRKNDGDLDLKVVSNKFVLKTVQQQQGRTLTDAVIACLTENEASGAVDAVEQFCVFLDENAVDSDAIEMDLKDLEDSNLNLLINGAVVVELMQSITCMFA